MVMAMMTIDGYDEDLLMTHSTSLPRSPFGASFSATSRGRPVFSGGRDSGGTLDPPPASPQQPPCAATLGDTWSPVLADGQLERG